MLNYVIWIASPRVMLSFFLFSQFDYLTFGPVFISIVCIINNLHDFSGIKATASLWLGIEEYHDN